MSDVSVTAKLFFSYLHDVQKKMPKWQKVVKMAKDAKNTRFGHYQRIVPNMAGGRES